MSISSTRYVNITSGLGGGNQVPTRLLIPRMFTGNLLLAPQSVLQFSNAADVGTFFGLFSEEYYRALFYFSFISKSLTSPQVLQFARWAVAASAPGIYPASSDSTLLANWTSISNGSLTLTLGGFTFTMSSMDFTAASNLDNVATIIQAAIQAETGGGAMWTAATVAYVPTGQNNGFHLVGGVAGVGNVSVATTSTGTDISSATLLGWLPGTQQGSIFSAGIYSLNSLWIPGSAIETITQALTTSSNSTNNFGSFLFLNNLNLSASQIAEAAIWNNAENVSYLYVAPVTAANYSTVVTQLALTNPEGTGLTLIQSPVTITGTIASASNAVTGLIGALSLQKGMPISGTNIPAGTVVLSIVSDTSITMSQNATGSAIEALTFNTVQFPEQLPTMIEASTDYTGINTVQNYMFQQATGLTPTVNTDSDANTYDAVAVNYY